MNINFKLMNNLIKFNETYTLEGMYSFLQKNYKDIYKTKDYIVAIGTIPIALVAHTDTVFDDEKVGITQKDLYYDKQKQVMFCPHGAGFDDKAGIYAITQIIKHGYRPTILLTTKEEKGGYGALALSEFNLLEKTSIKFLIELDRRGKNDCVFYDLDNKDFVKYIETFGFKERQGTFSDISFLMSKWKICGVNLSIGYMYEHSYSEILHVNWMHNTIKKVEQILDMRSYPDFEFKEIERFYNLNNNTNTALFNYDVQCEKCNRIYEDSETIPYKTKEGTKFICFNCLSDKIKWCEKCGEAFEGEGALCQDCIDGKNYKVISTK